MSKMYLALTVLLITTGAVQAQKFQAGIRGGVNWANYEAPREPYYATQETAPHPQLGFLGGFFVNYQLNAWLSVQPELLYSRKGTTFVTRYGGNTGPSTYSALEKHRIKLDYLELPLLVQMGGKRLFGQLGPQFGFLLGTRNELQSQVYANYPGSSTYNSTAYGTDGFEGWQCDVVAGAGYRFFKHLSLTARYSYGLVHVIKQLAVNPFSPRPRVFTAKELGHNQTLQLSLSYILLSAQP